MNSERNYRHAGYQQGIADGRITRGKINKKYVEFLLENETQNLSNQESQQYKDGWQDGFVDAVRVSTKKMVSQGDYVKKHLDNIFDIG